MKKQIFLTCALLCVASFAQANWFSDWWTATEKQVESFWASLTGAQTSHEKAGEDINKIQDTAKDVATHVENADVLAAAVAEAAQNLPEDHPAVQEAQEAVKDAQDAAKDAHKTVEQTSKTLERKEKSHQKETTQLAKKAQEKEDAAEDAVEKAKDAVNKVVVQANKSGKPHAHTSGSTSKNNANNVRPHNNKKAKPAVK